MTSRAKPMQIVVIMGESKCKTEGIIGMAGDSACKPRGIIEIIADARCEHAKVWKKVGMRFGFASKYQQSLVTLRASRKES